jgi:hypothetical protein
MKIKDIYRIGGIASIVNGAGEYLTEDDCQIVNKTNSSDSITLRLRRESDYMEGDSELKVLDEFKEIKDQLLHKVFSNPNIIGLTLAQLRNLDMDLEIGRFNGRLNIK